MILKNIRSLAFSWHNGIFDRYDIQNSIKKAERDRRSKSVFTTKIYEVIEGRVIPDWKKFISSGENKQSLTIVLDFSAITLSNILIRTVLSKKGNHFTWSVYFLILKQLKC